MPLMFYETRYTPEKAQSEVQRLLLSMGARTISLEYSDSREVRGITFAMESGGAEREFELPVRTGRVYDTLKRQGILRGMRAGRLVDPVAARVHASAVAWRTLLEWCKLQLAIIETNQVNSDEIMLPYLLVRTPGGGRRTIYEQFSSDRALEEPANA